VVQKVSYHDTSDKTQEVFWEAFEVQAGNKESAADTFEFLREADEGEVKINGLVSFFDKTKQDLDAKGFKTGGVLISNFAYSTPSQPDFWKNQGVEHNLRVKWKATQPVMKPPELETTPEVKWQYAVEAKAENQNWTEQREQQYQAEQAKEAQAAQAEKARAKAEILSKKKLEDTFEIRDWVRAMGPDYQNRIQQALAADPQLDIFAWLKQNFGVEVSDGAKLEGIMYLSP
jgi:hypothetical protein